MTERPVGFQKTALFALLGATGSWFISLLLSPTLEEFALGVGLAPLSVAAVPIRALVAGLLGAIITHIAISRGSHSWSFPAAIGLSMFFIRIAMYLPIGVGDAPEIVTGPALGIVGGQAAVAACLCLLGTIPHRGQRGVTPN